VNICVVRCREAIYVLFGGRGWGDPTSFRAYMDGLLEFLDLGAVFIIPRGAGSIIDDHYIELSRIY
jgi:hypothetical protein